MEQLQNTLYVLSSVLFLGALYAWYQFALVWREHTTCGGDGTCTNPWKSKCFVGAVFFTLALGISCYAVALVG